MTGSRDGREDGERRRRPLVASPLRGSRPDLIDALPPLPAVALRVIHLAHDPRSSAADLAMAISSDPALAARVLRVANSPLYRARREIVSVQEALVRLGFVQARNIAVSSAIAGAYAPDARNALFRIEEFWRHSLAVAFKASELAGSQPNGDVPAAFTAGLLHDIGRLALYYADPAGTDQAVARAIAENVSFDAIEEEALGMGHAFVGGQLAERWGLPHATVTAIARHHSNPEGGLAALVAAADAWCSSRGFLSGYRLPPPAGQRRHLEQDAARLARQVDQLIALITAECAPSRR